jgi:hypothetical protein
MGTCRQDVRVPSLVLLSWYSPFDCLALPAQQADGFIFGKTGAMLSRKA